MIEMVDRPDEALLKLVSDLRGKISALNMQLTKIRRDFQTLPQMLLEGVDDKQKRILIARWLYYCVPEVKETKIAYAYLGKYGERELLEEIGGIFFRCSVCDSEVEFRGRLSLRRLTLETIECNVCRTKLYHVSEHFDKYDNNLHGTARKVVLLDICPICKISWKELGINAA